MDDLLKCPICGDARFDEGPRCHYCDEAHAAGFREGVEAAVRRFYEGAAESHVAASVQSFLAALAQPADERGHDYENDGNGVCVHCGYKVVPAQPDATGEVDAMDGKGWARCVAHGREYVEGCRACDVARLPGGKPATGEVEVSVKWPVKEMSKEELAERFPREKL